MSIAYVKETYRMPWLKRGLAVLACGEPGKVTSATHYVWVRLDTSTRASLSPERREAAPYTDCTSKGKP